MKFRNPYFNIKEKIELLQRWIILHSYLYYERDTTLVSDTTYNNNAQQLIKLKSKYPEIFKESRYYKYFKDYNGSTGFDLYYRMKEDKENNNLDIIIEQAEYLLKKI